MLNVFEQGFENNAAKQNDGNNDSDGELAVNRSAFISSLLKIIFI